MDGRLWFLLQQRIGKTVELEQAQVAHSSWMAHCARLRAAEVWQAETVTVDEQSEVAKSDVSLEFESHSPQPEELKRSKQRRNTMENPYSPPQTSSHISADSAIRTSRHYGGIRRLPYLGIVIGLAIVQNVLIVAIGASDLTGAATLMLALFFMVVSFIPVYYRFKNIGMNPWWCLLMLVPIANLLVVIRCLVFQEGYVDTKKLDTAGRVVTYIVLGFFALVVALIIVVIISATGS